MGGFLPGLPGLPSLPGITPPGFLSTCSICPTCDGCPGAPSGGSKPGTTKPGTIPGITIPGIGTISIGLPGGSGPSAGSISVTPANLQAASTNFLSNPVGYLFGSSLLRIAFFILGIVCIIGAIYLYKDTRFIVQAPVEAARDAVRGAVAA